MALALFDLDDTLLEGDSDYLWGLHLVQKGVVDEDHYERTNREFYEQYKQGKLDIFEFSRFAFRPLSSHPLTQLQQWRSEYVEEKIKPIMLAKGIELIEKHRQAGDKLIIITSTNRFITEPIAALYNVHQLIATEPEIVKGKFTGELATPCFAHHKVDRLNEWLELSGDNLDESRAYSDSHNDIPLLETVTHPVAVDPDEKLRVHAEKNGWQVISLRK